MDDVFVSNYWVGSLIYYKFGYNVNSEPEHSQLLIKVFFLHVVLPLIVGFIWYLAFYDYQNLFLSKWIPECDIFKSQQYIMPKWLKYSFPDGLWAYSSTSLFLRFGKKLFLSNIKLVIVAFCVVILPELLQFLFPRTGTFDFYDTFVIGCGFSLSLKIHKNAS